MDISKIAINEAFSLTAQAGLPAGYHVFEPAHIRAIEAAWFAGRPLLVKGEPGLGKSQIAHAIAQRLGWNLLTHVVHSRTEAEDLLYTVDHVSRLAKAQLLGTVGGDIGELAHQNFVVPGPLWWAYAPDSASDFFDQSKEYNSSFKIQRANKPFVLLIDEIDKAERDLPNALLEILNNQSFHVPFRGEPLIVEPEKRPFVVVTSNDEKSLPAAFLRRCAVLKLSLDSGEEGQTQLLRIADAHKPEFNNLNTETFTTVARLVIEHRNQLSAEQYRPGVSEFLDLLRVLNNQPAYRKTENLEAVLQALSEHFLVKQ